MTATSRHGLRALLSTLLVAAALPAFATAPGLLTYQGRLKESGFPVTGARTIDLFVCPDAVTPVANCYDTGAQAVSVVNGLFRLNFSAPDGAPPTGVNWTSGQQYLQVQVGANLFTPRELMSSTAYAVYSSSAATLVENPGDSAVFITPDVAIAGDGFSVGSSSFVVRGSSVGVRTASPGAALDVNGDLRVNGNVTVDGAGHLRATGVGASLPIPGAGCGTGASIAGSDTAGRVTMGTAPGSTCIIVFGTPWASVPVCHFTDETGNNAAIGVSPTPTTTSVVMSVSSSFAAGGVYTYLCLSY